MNNSQIEDPPTNKEETAEIIIKQAKDFKKKLEQWRGLFAEIPGVFATIWNIEDSDTIIKLSIPMNNKHLVNEDYTADLLAIHLLRNGKYNFKYNHALVKESSALFVDWCEDIDKSDNKSWSYLYTMLLTLSSAYSELPELPVNTVK